MIEIVPIAQVSADAVEHLLDRAFGPDRHLRTAYAIRAGTRAIPALSFAAIEDGVLVGTIQCWPVRLALDAGGSAPLVMLGPVAVEPARQRSGIGQLLTAHTIRVSDEAGSDEPMMLIGDPEYYGRFFGFDDSATAAWRCPGPVEQRRLLARGATGSLAGMLAPRVVAPA